MSNGSKAIGLPQVPVVMAHEWKDGMEVPEGELVAVKGAFYFNESGKASTNNPVTSEDFSSGLQGAGVIAHIAKHYIKQQLK